MEPEIGTMVFKWSEGCCAASQLVVPAYDLPISPTLPLDQFCSPNQSTTACIPVCSPRPFTSWQWVDFPVPKVDAWASAYPWGRNVS